MSNKSKTKKLSVYTICLFLSVIIVIIIASMADHRENAFKAQLNETTAENVTFESTIVNLTNENDALKKEIEGLKAEISNSGELLNIYATISAAISLSNSGDIEGAKAKLSEIDRTTLSDDTAIIYDATKANISKD